jgi:hypothetical protein
VEFISGIFFNLYNCTILQLKDYHASLLEGKNVLLSFKVVDDLKTESDKVKILEKMMVYLVSKPESHKAGSKESPAKQVAET